MDFKKQENKNNFKKAINKQMFWKHFGEEEKKTKGVGMAYCWVVYFSRKKKRVNI